MIEYPFHKLSNISGIFWEITQSPLTKLISLWQQHSRVKSIIGGDSNEYSIITFPCHVILEYIRIGNKETTVISSLDKANVSG